MAGATTLAVLVLAVCVCVASGTPVSIGDVRVRERGESSNVGDLNNDKEIISETLIEEYPNTSYQNDKIDEKTREQSKNEISTSIISTDNDGRSQNIRDDRIKRSRRSYHDVDRWDGRNHGYHGHHGRSSRITVGDDYDEDRYNGRGRRGSGGRVRGGNSYEDYSGESGGRGKGSSSYKDHSAGEKCEGTSVGGGSSGVGGIGIGLGVKWGNTEFTGAGGGSLYGNGTGFAKQCG